MVRAVPIDLVVAEQETVFVNILLAYAEGVTRGSDPVRARLGPDGLYHLTNGTHRYVVAALRGDRELDLEVVE